MRRITTVVLVVLCAGCALRHPYEDPKNLGEMIATIQQANPNAVVAVKTNRVSVPGPSAADGDPAPIPKVFDWKVSADDGFAHHWFTIFEMKIGSPTVRYEVIVINGANTSRWQYEDSGDDDVLSPVIGKEKKQ